MTRSRPSSRACSLTCAPKLTAQGGRWNRETRRFVEAEGSAHLGLTTSISPSDVENIGELGGDGQLVAVYLHKSRALTVLVCADLSLRTYPYGPGAPSSSGSSHTHRTRPQVELLGGAVGLELGERDWEVATLSPVYSVGGGGLGPKAAPREWAPLGLTSMLNGGGAVLATSIREAKSLGSGAVATTRLRGAGDFGACVGACLMSLSARRALTRYHSALASCRYCRPKPSAVTVNGQPAPYAYDEASGMLAVPMERGADEVEVGVRF